ncbi:MAG: iron ABC transporter permease [Microbacteriaceae bacterium]|nr:MAG: iron ABC transporter permease [Microbacteriaceae bacterium]
MTLAVIVVVVSLVNLIPAGSVVVAGVATGWSTLSGLVFRERVGELLSNTALLVVVGVPISAALGVGCAWLVERSTLPGARAFALLFIAPLAIPAFVNSYGWVSAIPSLNGLWAGVLLATLSYFPLIYLPCAAALRRLDPALEEIAASLGDRPWRIFFRVIVPQLRLPVLGGGLLVGLHLLAEYGAFAMVRFDTFTTAIVEQFQSTFNGPAATALSALLVLCCLVLLAVESAARGRSRFARIGSGVPRSPSRTVLAGFTVPAMLFAVVLVWLSLGVPLYNITRWLIIGGMTVWLNDLILTAFAQTLGFGLAGAAVACAATLPIALVAVRFPSPFVRALEAVNYTTSSLPGIVTALALVTVSIRFVQPLYQTVWLVIAAYVLMFLPRALINLRSGLAQSPIALEEAARSLGRNPARAFWTVTGRMLVPAALSGGALVFLGIVTELTATLLLAPSGMHTLAIQFWSKVNDIDYAAAAPFAVLMVVLSLPVTFLLFSRSRLVNYS